MPEAPERLRRQQLAFAAHLRDPAATPAPAGIEDRRLAVYRELFYNNVEGLLASNFPVIRTLLADTGWHGLVRAFYREHRAHTPLFPEIGREFLRYLETRAQRGSDDAAIDLPFLLELAHYEWVELALSLDETDLAAIPHRRDGDLLQDVPVPSPLAWPLAYRWPVHRIAPGAVPAHAPPAPTFLLVLRDRGDRVRFKEINAVSFRLMQALHGNEQRRSGRALLQSLARDAGADPARFVAEGGMVLERLREGDAILGVAPGAGSAPTSPDAPASAR